MTNAVPRVLELLTYIEQVEKLKSKPAFAIPTEYFVAHQHELKGLPELQFDLQVDDGEVWLRVPRLKEISAPPLLEELTPWDQCESGFELEMFDELVKRGYRVQPQVACGGYFIDFVVEGDEGRRLAIECDGDRYHGPGQWSADMACQRVLERAGWTFWRTFASSFVRRREEVLDDLLSTLEQQGIKPLGSESVDNTVWVASKRSRPVRGGR